MSSELKFKTYNLGLIQAKSFRFLKQKGTDMLKKYDISTTDWAILGLMYEKKTMTKTEVSNILMFKKPFITKLVQDLKNKKYIQETLDSLDKRSEILSLTEYGVSFVEKTETEISFMYNLFLSFFDKDDFNSYLKFITTISVIGDTSNYKDKSDKVYKN